MRHRRNSDAEIRAYERAVRDDPSDLGAGARLIVARIRAGLTTRERVVMAARLRHEAARVVVPEWVELGPIGIGVGTNAAYEVFTEIIGATMDHRETVSFACDCAERVLPIFEQAMPNDNRPRRAIEAARRWIVSPSGVTVNDARIASYGCLEAANEVEYVRGDNGEEVYAAHAAGAVGGVVYGDYPGGDNVDGFVYVSSISSAHSTLSYAAYAAYEDDEIVWQQARLCQYLVGDVMLPPLVELRQNPSADSGDMQLRMLERAVAADPSDIDSGARLIAARIRAGLTTRKRVVMAALLGDEAARLVYPNWVGHDVINWDILWLRQEAINTLVDRREIVSFACDCAERVLGAFERQYPDDMRPRKTIEAARAWVIDPSTKNIESVRESANVFNRSGGSGSNRSYYTAAVDAALTVICTHSQADYYAAQAVSYAAYAASHVLDVDADVDQVSIFLDEEYVWQQERLAKYLVGGVSMPPVGSNLK